MSGQAPEWTGWKGWLNNVSMNLKMWSAIIGTLVCIHIFVLAIAVARLNDPMKLRQARQYYLASWWGEFHKATVTVGVDGSGRPIDIVTDGDIAVKTLEPVKNEVRERAGGIFLFSLVIYALTPFIVRVFRAKTEAMSASKHIRGSLLVSEKGLAGILMDKHPCRIKITQYVKLPISMETKHVFVVGKSGEGKTVQFTNVVAQTLENPAFRQIIYDYKGDYIKRFYDPAAHILFNPFDDDCVRWNLFREIADPYDIPNLAGSLIPNLKSEGVEGYFNDAARDVFAGLLAYANNNGYYRTNSELWRIINDKFEAVKGYLAETSEGQRAARHVSAAESGQTAGVLSTLNRFVGALQYVKDLDGPFSFREWVRDPSPKKKVIFIANSPKMEEAMAPLLSLVIDLLANEVISLDDNLTDNNRIFFFVDELGTLQAIPSLVRFLTLSRSKGGSMWMGIQDFGRLHLLYGPKITGTIYNNTEVRLVLRVEDPDTAKYLSDSFGEREYKESVESYSMGVGQQHWRDGFSIAEQTRRDKLILDSEITNLEPLTGFLKVGPNPIAKVTIPLLKKG